MTQQRKGTALALAGLFLISGCGRDNASSTQIPVSPDTIPNISTAVDKGSIILGDDLQAILMATPISRVSNESEEDLLSHIFYSRLMLIRAEERDEDGTLLKCIEESASFPNLRSLTIDNGSRSLTSQELRSMFSLTQIERICIGNSSGIAKAINLSDLANIEMLELGNPTDADIAFLANIGEPIPELCLYFSDFGDRSDASDASLERLLRANVVESLSISDSRQDGLTGEFLSGIEDATNLHSISIQSQSLASGSLAAIKNAPSLRLLWIAGGNITVNRVKELEGMQGLEAMLLTGIDKEGTELLDFASLSDCFLVVPHSEAIQKSFIEQGFGYDAPFFYRYDGNGVSVAAKEWFTDELMFFATEQGKH